MLSERRAMKHESVNHMQEWRGVAWRGEESEIKAYQEYVLNSESWTHDGFWSTLYEGYPFKPRCEPYRPDMEWYVSPATQHFGVWVLNRSKEPIQATPGRYGWNPFVRKSTAPIGEPLNVRSAEIRNCICWIVDEAGWGQYGMIMPDGYIWVPHKRPAGWVDPYEECQ